jgi:hypothetical protein
MKSLAIIFFIVSIIEGVFIFWLVRRNKKQNADKISSNSLKNAFEKFGSKIEDISESNLENNLRMFKLKIQNEEYKRAESRVLEQFDILLNELWRLQKVENSEIASNLLTIINNTISLKFEENKALKYNSGVEEKYELLSIAGENDYLEIVRPAWLMNGKVIIKGKAKRKE